MATASWKVWFAQSLCESGAFAKMSAVSIPVYFTIRARVRSKGFSYAVQQRVEKGDLIAEIEFEDLSGLVGRESRALQRSIAELVELGWLKRESPKVYLLGTSKRFFADVLCDQAMAAKGVPTGGEEPPVEESGAPKETRFSPKETRFSPKETRFSPKETRFSPKETRQRGDSSMISGPVDGAPEVVSGIWNMVIEEKKEEEEDVVPTSNSSLSSNRLDQDQDLVDGEDQGEVLRCVADATRPQRSQPLARAAGPRARDPRPVRRCAVVEPASPPSAAPAGRARPSWSSSNRLDYLPGVDSGVPGKSTAKALDPTAQRNLPAMDRVDTVESTSAESAGADVRPMRPGYVADPDIAGRVLPAAELRMLVNARRKVAEGRAHELDGEEIIAAWRSMFFREFEIEDPSMPFKIDRVRAHQLFSLAAIRLEGGDRGAMFNFLRDALRWWNEVSKKETYPSGLPTMKGLLEGKTRGTPSHPYGLWKTGGMRRARERVRKATR